jgi:hypothetical protein
MHIRSGRKAWDANNDKSPSETPVSLSLKFIIADYFSSLCKETNIYASRSLSLSLRFVNLPEETNLYPTVSSAMCLAVVGIQWSIMCVASR